MSVDISISPGDFPDLLTSITSPYDRCIVTAPFPPTFPSGRTGESPCFSCKFKASKENEEYTFNETTNNSSKFQP